MGRGLGTAQRTALDLLADAHARSEGIYVAALAERLGLSVRRTHALVDSLRARGLVWTELRGWVDGIGERGPLVSSIGWPRVPVTETTPGARWVPWWEGSTRGTWKAPGGLPGRGMIVMWGDPPPGIFGTVRDRHGRSVAGGRDAERAAVVNIPAHL